MLEEKSVKHWLKRKVKVTEALLVAFLITGGIASAESANASSSNKMKYYGVSEESMPGTGEKEPKNEYGEGARGGKKSIAIGENAKVGTWKTIWEKHIGTVNEGYNFYYGKDKDYKLTQADVGKVYFSDGDNSVVLGNDAKSDYANSVVIGTQADSTRGNSNVVVGHKAKLSGHNGVVIGENSIGSSSNLGVIAIGKHSRAAGGIVIGTEATLGRWTDKKGEETSEEDLGGGIVIGRKASATTLTNVVIGDEAYSDNKWNVVLGSYAKVKNENATAVGNAATVTVDGGIALGGSSSSTTEGRKMGYDPMTGKTRENLDKVSSVWKSSTGALSVGKSGYTRQITNVAAGSEDTDAVNVAQLKALNTKVDKGASHYYSVNDMNHHVDNFNNDGAKGLFSTVAGPGSTIKIKNGFQGATSAILGSFNTIDAGDKEFDGVANSIVGVANTTKDANGSLIFGAGNKITNSYRGVDFTKLKGNGLNLSDSQSVAEALGKLVANSGGSVLAIGGANTADYATLSKVIGVGNTLKGSAQNESTLNMIDGFKNTGTNIKNTTIVGSENTVENGSSNILIGDKHKLKKVSNSVILGSTEQETETTVSDVVSIGHNAKVEKKGGIALGSSSVANREKGQAGFDISTNLASTDKSATWKATHSALSIGDGSTVTRQITGVAAGRADTDAVNVAQLKSVLSHPFHVFSGGKDISKGTNFTFYQMNWDFRDGLKQLWKEREKIEKLWYL